MNALRLESKANPNAQYVIEVFELVTSMLFDQLDQT